MDNTNKGVERHQTAILCQYNSTVSNHVPLGMKPRRRKRGKGESAERLRTKKKKLSAEQVNLLEMNFETEQKLECARKDRLAAELGLDPRQVAVWFQNRRVRWKSKQLEEDSSMLKNINEILMEEKWHLEAEVSNLKEQLLEAEKEIHRLSERSGIASEGERQCSPRSTSSSADNHPFLGGFNMDDNFGFLFMAQTSYVSDMEWINFGF